MLQAPNIFSRISWLWTNSIYIAVTQFHAKGKNKNSEKSKAVGKGRVPTRGTTQCTFNVI